MTTAWVVILNLGNASANLSGKVNYHGVIFNTLLNILVSIISFLLKESSVNHVVQKENGAKVVVRRVIA